MSLLKVRCDHYTVTFLKLELTLRLWYKVHLRDALQWFILFNPCKSCCGNRTNHAGTVDGTGHEDGTGGYLRIEASTDFGRVLVAATWTGKSEAGAIACCCERLYDLHEAPDLMGLACDVDPVVGGIHFD